MPQPPDLKDARARLKAFRAAGNEGDAIDEGSGLSTDDLDVVSAFVNDFPSSD
jgi:hypothetical protein